MVLGCAAGAPAPEPSDVGARISASATINPGASGSAQSVDVVILQLKSADAFRSVGLLALYPETDKLRAALGEELVSSNRRQIRPEEQLEWTLALDPQARFVGVFAAFEQYDRANWRADVQVRDESLADKLLFRNKRLNISVDDVNIAVELD